MVNPLGMAPRDTVEELVGGPAGIGQGTNGEVGGGARAVASGLEGLVVSHPRRPLIR